MDRFNQYREQYLASMEMGRRMEKVAQDMGLVIHGTEILFESEAQEEEYKRRLRAIE